MKIANSVKRLRISFHHIMAVSTMHVQVDKTRRQKVSAKIDRIVGRQPRRAQLSDLPVSHDNVDVRPN